MIQSGKIISSFIWKLLERFSSQAISLLVAIILARLLLPADFGIIAILVVFIELANVIIDGGLNTALVQKKRLMIWISPPFYSLVWHQQVSCFLFYLGSPHLSLISTATRF